MFEGRSSRTSPAKKQKVSGGAAGPAAASSWETSVPASTATADLHQPPVGVGVSGPSYGISIPIGTQIPSCTPSEVNASSLGALSALPAVIVHGTGGRGGRGRGRSGGRTKLG